MRRKSEPKEMHHVCRERWRWESCSGALRTSTFSKSPVRDRRCTSRAVAGRPDAGDNGNRMNGSKFLVILRWVGIGASFILMNANAQQKTVEKKSAKAIFYRTKQ